MFMEFYASGDFDASEVTKIMLDLRATVTFVDGMCEVFTGLDAIVLGNYLDNKATLDLYAYLDKGG